MRRQSQFLIALAFDRLGLLTALACLFGDQKVGNTPRASRKSLLLGIPRRAAARQSLPGSDAFSPLASTPAHTPVLLPSRRPPPPPPPPPRLTLSASARLSFSKEILATGKGLQTRKGQINDNRGKANERLTRSATPRRPRPPFLLLFVCVCLSLFLCLGRSGGLYGWMGDWKGVTNTQRLKKSKNKRDDQQQAKHRCVGTLFSDCIMSVAPRPEKQQQQQKNTNNIVWKLEHKG